jgi:hypothetical protein
MTKSDRSRRDLVKLGYHLRDVQKYPLEDETLKALEYLEPRRTAGYKSEMQIPGTEIMNLMPMASRRSIGGWRAAEPHSLEARHHGFVRPVSTTTISTGTMMLHSYLGLLRADSRTSTKTRLGRMIPRAGFHRQARTRCARKRYP